MLLAKKLISSNNSGSDLFDESEVKVKRKLEIESQQKVNILAAGKKLLARVAKGHGSHRYIFIKLKPEKVNF